MKVQFLFIVIFLSVVFDHNLLWYIFSSNVFPSILSDVIQPQTASGTCAVHLQIIIIIALLNDHAVMSSITPLGIQCTEGFKKNPLLQSEEVAEKKRRRR